MKQNKPVEIPVMSFQDAINEKIEAQKKNLAYIKKTGKCPSCKKNKVVPGNDRCQSCTDEVNKILRELSKDKGFCHLQIPV
jgi:hypothetical protein